MLGDDPLPFLYVICFPFVGDTGGMHGRRLCRSCSDDKRCFRQSLVDGFNVGTQTQAEGLKTKWKKKATLAEKEGGIGKLGFEDVGLKGTIPVVFKQGNVTKSTMARAGQPLRDVATQAGQFIKYGCGKGECGTCEALCNGQWIRPCSTFVPNLSPGEEYVIQVKEVKAKVVSSGKFYSFRSFILGFWVSAPRVLYCSVFVPSFPLVLAQLTAH